MTFNGKVTTKNWLSYREMMKGATVDMRMSAQPNLKRGVKEEDFPYSFSREGR